MEEDESAPRVSPPKKQPPAEPKWNPITGNPIRGMWQTRELNEDDDRELMIRTTLRELIVYLAFLTVLTMLVFTTHSSISYVYTQVLSDLFLNSEFSDDDDTTFADASQMKDFWNYMQGAFLDGLYWNAWYDINRTTTDRRDQMILYENKLIGVPRMRQLRVRSDSCRVADDMRFFIKKCFAEYSWLTEVKPDTKFGKGKGTKGTAWVYKSEKDLGSRFYWGRVNSYYGGGSYVDFALERNETEQVIADLRSNLWTGRDTRAVFIDFTVYNANINLFCIIKLAFEFPPTGGMITSSSFTTSKLIKYVTPRDYFALACEVMFVIFIAYYIIEEMIEIVKLRGGYFQDAWNVADVMFVILGILCVVFSVHSVKTFDEKVRQLLKNDREHANFEFLAFYETQYSNAVAIIVFLAWVKLFKYINFNKTMSQLSSTLSNCAADIAGFGIMFFIVFFAFAQLGYLLFGSQVESFSSLKIATFTLLLTILGDFDFDEIEKANRILGPIYFLSYVFFVFFVLMNMFLAIINDTYSEVKQGSDSKKKEFNVADFLRRGYNNIRGMIGKRDRIIDLENALKLTPSDDDGNYSFNQIWKNLKRCGFSDEEIELIFLRYDISSRDLDTDERTKILAELEEQRKELNLDLETIHHVVFGDISIEEAGELLRGVHSQEGGGDGTGEHHDLLEDEHGYDYEHYDDYPTVEEFIDVSRRINSIENYMNASTAKINKLLSRLRMLENKTGMRNGSVVSELLNDGVGPPYESDNNFTNNDGMKQSAKFQGMPDLEPRKDSNAVQNSMNTTAPPENSPEPTPSTGSSTQTKRVSKLSLATTPRMSQPPLEADTGQQPTQTSDQSKLLMQQSPVSQNPKPSSQQEHESPESRRTSTAKSSILESEAPELSGPSLQSMKDSPEIGRASARKPPSLGSDPQGLRGPSSQPVNDSPKSRRTSARKPSTVGSDSTELSEPSSQPEQDSPDSRRTSAKKPYAVGSDSPRLGGPSSQREQDIPDGRRNSARKPSSMGSNSPGLRRPPSQPAHESPEIRRTSGGKPALASHSPGLGGTSSQPEQESSPDSRHSSDRKTPTLGFDPPGLSRLSNFIPKTQELRQSAHLDSNVFDSMKRTHKPGTAKRSLVLQPTGSEERVSEEAQNTSLLPMNAHEPQKVFRLSSEVLEQRQPELPEIIQTAQRESVSQKSRQSAQMSENSSDPTRLTSITPAPLETRRASKLTTETGEPSELSRSRLEFHKGSKSSQPVPGSEETRRISRLDPESSDTRRPSPGSDELQERKTSAAQSDPKVARKPSGLPVEPTDPPQTSQMSVNHEMPRRESIELPDPQDARKASGSAAERSERHRASQPAPGLAEPRKTSQVPSATLETKPLGRESPDHRRDSHLRRSSQIQHDPENRGSRKVSQQAAPEPRRASAQQQERAELMEVSEAAPAAETYLPKPHQSQEVTPDHDNSLTAYDTRRNSSLQTSFTPGGSLPVASTSSGQVRRRSSQLETPAQHAHGPSQRADHADTTLAAYDTRRNSSLQTSFTPGGSLPVASISSGQLQRQSSQPQPTAQQPKRLSQIAAEFKEQKRLSQLPQRLSQEQHSQPPAVQEANTGRTDTTKGSADQSQTAPGQSRQTEKPPEAS